MKVICVCVCVCMKMINQIRRYIGIFRNQCRSSGLQYLYSLPKHDVAPKYNVVVSLESFKAMIMDKILPKCVSTNLIYDRACLTIEHTKSNEIHIKIYMFVNSSKIILQ